MNEETDTNEDEAAADDWASALEEQADSEAEATAEGGDDYSAAEFQDLQEDVTNQLPMDEKLDVILEIPVSLSMEIGRTNISIRNLLQLNQGSVVELDRLAGEPMDVMVNGTLIAHGEVVVVNEKFGIRLTDVISPAERVKKLK
jgi:flagellar motor switch protein FliN/FliY